MKLTFKTIACSLSLALFSQASTADNYQIELVAGYLSGDVGSADLKAGAIAGQYFFSQVDNSKGPTAQASFLDRASSASVFYIDGEVDGSDLTIDTEITSVELRLVSKSSGWTGGIEISQSEVDDIDTQTYEISIGKYIAKNTELSLQISSEDEDQQDEFETWKINFNHVATNTDIPYAFSIGAGELLPPSGNNDIILNISGTAYPKNNFGIGVDFETVYSNPDSYFVDIFAEWFVTDNLASRLTFSKGSISNISNDSVGIEALFRF